MNRPTHPVQLVLMRLEQSYRPGHSLVQETIMSADPGGNSLSDLALDLVLFLARKIDRLVITVRDETNFIAKPVALHVSKVSTPTHSDHSRGHIGSPLKITRAAARHIVVAEDHLLRRSASQRHIDHCLELFAGVRVCCQRDKAQYQPLSCSGS